MDLGMITLYITGVSTEEWTAGWYYAEEDKYIRNVEYYPPAGFETPWRLSSDPCTPPDPIDLNNLMIQIETYSEKDVCPLTGYLGSCWWGEFGPFVVEDGKTYCINAQTGVLTEGVPITDWLTPLIGLVLLMAMVGMMVPMMKKGFG